MIKKTAFIFSLALAATTGLGQTSPSPQPRAQSPATQSAASPKFELSEYGVSMQTDARLIVMMAALEAAGFDPTPAAREPSAFRALVRRDQARMNADLRERMKNSFERHKLPAPATPAEQAARYVSLAYVLSPPPLLESPDRTDDLPGGALEVLDFAPLLREFYKSSGIDERLNSYMRAYQAEGDRLRQPAGEMVRSLLSYLHTRPIMFTNVRVRVNSPTTKKNAPASFTTRQHDRRFFVVPDLLAAPGTINFRVIADDYYAIVPEGTDPASSELRRAYLQYVIDPLVLKINKEIAARREPLKQLIDKRTADGATVSPDVFLTVSRSLVAAADATYEASNRLTLVTALQRARLQQAKDDAARTAIANEAKAARAAIADETIARLSEDYENGALLDFYFAEQMRDVEASGFDIANFLADMIAGFDPAREGKRFAETAEARNRVLAARKAHPRYSLWLVDPSAETRDANEISHNSVLVTKLGEVEKLLQTRSYEEAETRLKGLLQDYPGDARLFFTLAQTASLWARDTTDDDFQNQRLNRALTNYRLAVAAASPDIDRALLSRAHEAMGRILAFLDHNDEAMKEFEAAISIGEVTGGAYRDAIEGKRKLSQP